MKTGRYGFIIGCKLGGCQKVTVLGSDNARRKIKERIFGSLGNVKSPL